MSVTEMKRHVIGCSDVMIQDARVIDFSWSDMLNFGEIKRERDLIQPQSACFSFVGQITSCNHITKP